MKSILYILSFWVLGYQITYSQNLNDKEFEELLEELFDKEEDGSIGNVVDKLDEINKLLEEPVENESSYEEEDYSNYNKSNKTQKEYLNTPIKKKRFSRAEWERIRRNVVDDVLEKGGGEREGSSYGERKMVDRDNPYQQSEKNYQKYLDEQRRSSNSKRIKRKQKEIKRRPQKNKPRNSSNWGDGFTVSPLVGKILLIIVVIILAGLIFYLFFKAPISKKTQKIDRDIEDISPTEIPKTELELMLEKAIAAKDYRRAIRIYFIFIIRGLSEKEWIQWEKEKTNIIYLLEMRKNKHYSEFDNLVSIYEIVWYGKRILDETTYRKIEPEFKNLVKKLDQ